MWHVEATEEAVNPYDNWDENTFLPNCEACGSHSTMILNDPEFGGNHLYCDNCGYVPGVKYPGLSWQPGTRGKGLVFNNGEVHTWPIDEMDSPHHGHYNAYTKAKGGTALPFNISPEGEVYAEGHGGIGTRSDAWDQARKAEPRLWSEIQGTRDESGFGHGQNIMDIMGPHVPAPVTKVGATTVSWWEGQPGDAVVMAEGGSVDDQALGANVITAQLEAIGYKRAQFTFDAEHHTAGWPDIMQKAKRLIQSGNVTLLRNGWENIVAHVIGDHGEYNSEIAREDPESRTITQWTCECPWDQYAFQRCVKIGTMITLADGRTSPVEDIRVGDAVIDHVGELGIVADTHIESWDDQVVILKTTGFSDLAVKPDHPVLVVPAERVWCRNRNGERAKFGKARKGDFCALDSCGCRNPRTASVEPIFKKAEEIEVGDFLVRPTSRIEIPKTSLDLTEYMSAQTIIEENQIVPTREFTTRWGTATVAKQKKAALPRSVDISEGLLRLVGYYLAEGTITDYSIRFTFHEDEVEYHKDVATLGEEIFGVTPRYENGQSVKIISFNNRELATIFTNLLGRHVTKKAIPDWMMWLSPRLQSSLIEGWFRGDGHIRKSDGRHELTTVSSTLAYQGELILQRLGYTVGCIFDDKVYPSSKANEKAKYKLYWLTSQRHNRGVRFRENDDTLVKLVAVEREDYKGDLVDLSIIGNPGYLAEGFAVHNTRQWKKYEARPCAHVLAAFWKSQATPLDEGPPEGQNLPPGQKQGEPAPPPPPEGGGAPPGGAPPQGEPAPAQTSFGPEEAAGTSAPMAPPAPSGALPTPPMDQLAEQMPPVPGQTPGGMPANPNVVSVPGAKMPSPFNPMQYPGGTYSSVKTSVEEFAAPEIVRLKVEGYGMAEGKSEAHGAGQYQNIPMGTTGEVLYQDPSTGYVEAIFPLKGGPLSPYHVKMYVNPSEIEHTDAKPPGPFIKRR
jgi:intein/homing endonuclease